MSEILCLPLLDRATAIEGLHPSLKSILLWLCLDADRNGVDFSNKSSRRIADELCLGHRTVRRGLSILAEQGLILRLGVAGDIDWKTIVDPQPLAEPMNPRCAATKRSKISPLKRRLVMERDQYRCKKCGDYRNLSIDHIVSIANGGGNDEANLQILCQPCNQDKGSGL